MAGKKKGAVGKGAGRSMPNAFERARNRASPAPVVKLYDHFTTQQKGSIADMGLEAMLDIKCHSLHNPLISWLGPLYDKHQRVFVIPGRGRIPLNAQSVFHTLALPRGDQPVRYELDTEIEARIARDLFPGQSSTPKISDVFNMLKDMKLYDRIFKQMWMMYLTCTLLAPNTCNKVSSRVYPILDKIDVVQDMNICQFVCDMLHEELSSDRVSGSCLFHMQLLYVDSLDISSLDIVLPEGRCVANIWSKDNIEFVLNADLKKDGSGYGNLELKPHLAINVNLFGGAVAFEHWIHTNSAPNCSKERKDKVSKLIGEFTSGLTGLLGKLVQGWTELDEISHARMEEVFEDVSNGIGTTLATDVVRPRKKATSTVPPQSDSVNPLLSSDVVRPRKKATSTVLPQSDSVNPLLSSDIVRPKKKATSTVPPQSDSGNSLLSSVVVKPRNKSASTVPSQSDFGNPALNKSQNDNSDVLPNDCSGPSELNPLNCSALDKLAETASVAAKMLHKESDHVEEKRASIDAKHGQSETVVEKTSDHVLSDVGVSNPEDVVHTVDVPDSADISVLSFRKRKLRSSAKDDLASSCTVGAKSTPADQIAYDSPPRKHTKVVDKSMVEVGPKAQGIRSSPRLKSNLKPTSM